MNKQKLYWVSQIIGWAIYTVINIIIATVVVGNQETPLIWYLPLITEGLFFLFSTHLLRFLAKKRKWIDLTIPKLSVRIIFTAFAIGTTIYLLRIGISWTLGVFPSNSLSMINIAGNTFPNTLVVFIWALFYFIFQYFDRYNKSLKQEAAFHQIELNNLKSQLNPHFIFNSLNSIRALVDENPAKSKTAITQLSNILRNSLTTDQKRVARFEDEMKIVEDYLSLETIRYEERLQTKVVIDPNSYDFNIPPLMLQTLVENGIKHGVSRLKRGGLLTITTIVNDNNLKIEIRNSGKLENKVQLLNPVGGLGIANTTKRLKLIFGDNAHFSIKAETPDTVLTELIIPKAQEI